MDFGRALKFIRGGAAVRRAGWNGKGMFLVIIEADGYKVFGSVYPLLPFIAMKTADGMMVPWLASQSDLLAEDWEVVL
nr:DUF2829 domain-containing protein [uncultured Albidiferax sp.]